MNNLTFYLKPWDSQHNDLPSRGTTSICGIQQRSQAQIGSKSYIICQRPRRPKRGSISISHYQSRQSPIRGSRII